MHSEIQGIEAVDGCSISSRRGSGCGSANYGGPPGLEPNVAAALGVRADARTYLRNKNNSKPYIRGGYLDRFLEQNHSIR